jgi:DNA-binding NarL/FixJ family response regulator
MSDMGMRNVKVLISGHSLASRSAIRRYVESISPDVRVVAAATNLRAAVIMTRSYAPHLVVLAGGSEHDYLEEAVAAIHAATSQRVHVVVIPDHARSTGR